MYESDANVVSETQCEDEGRGGCQTWMKVKEAKLRYPVPSPQGALYALLHHYKSAVADKPVRLISSKK